MSGLTGKKSSTLKKEQVKENKLLSTGVKSIKFWHEAQADGETSIPFGSLQLPTAIANQGLSNPTSTEILSANLALFHTNVEVHSSLNQKLMEGLSYIVKNNQIKFINGYESTEGEIFAVVYKNDVITGTNVVDARPLTATGVLTAGQQDFNVGEAFKTNAYPSHQIGEVIVFVDGEIQFRNTANATAGAGADGNYQEVHSAQGYGTIIRFNEPFLADKNVVVMSRNLIAERPDISMMQLIEKLGGQLDEVIQYVAALAGVDESEFYVAPNQIDLKAFGDQVISNKQNIADLQVTKQDIFSIKHQTKTLGANTSSSPAGVIAGLTFNNLALGKTYRLTGYVSCNDTQLLIYYNGVQIGGAGTQPNNGDAVQGAISLIFTTTISTVLEARKDGQAGTIYQGTYLTLEELPFHTPTTDWT